MSRVYFVTLAVAASMVAAVAEDAPVPKEPEETGFTHIVPGLEDEPLSVELDGKFKIGKIHEFINDPKYTRVKENRPVGFEFKYINHGAVTEEERMRRQGHYFLLNWENAGAPANVVVRFDYRQEGRREEVKTLEIEYPVAQGSQKAKFEIIGESYKLYGRIHSWRLTIIKDEVVVAERKSFVW